jgi:hypothetical protein
MAATGEQKLRAWFAARLPSDWFTRPVDVLYDRDEIVVVGDLAEPPRRDDDPGHHAASCLRAIECFREDTRALRVHVAAEAEHRFGRKVGWGARCGPVRRIFTALSVPVMTRLRIDERRVLDTLVDASIARSRSDALAWCVRLVHEHEGQWIDELRAALVHVDEVRGAGPNPRDDGGDEL